MFAKVLIANRGEIACRILRTLREMKVASVVVHSEVDAYTRAVLEADEAICIGSASPAESYLNTTAVLEAARRCGAEAIHPGYGFLSENSDFAEACENAGIAFIGPTSEHMRAFGLKHTARALAERSGVPLLPGSGLLADLAHGIREADRIGFPVMLKSTAGGGGIGMRLCKDRTELEQAFPLVQRLGQNNFSDAGIFLEKFVASARHIEVQIFGDGKGKVIALGERDCSLQRRNQKVIEETPAPNISNKLRTELCQAAIRLGETAGYRSAGTVEFIFDTESSQFYFLEVNTRLQVEHGVTEAVTGVDLVEWMIRLAAGDDSPITNYRHQPQGHAIQARIYAEDPQNDFQPCSGLITNWERPKGLRCDDWIEAGLEVSPYYDPLLAKVITHNENRASAIASMRKAFGKMRIDGITTNIDYLGQIFADPTVTKGQATTRFLSGFNFNPRSVEVLSSGTQTSIQDYPGRLGYWNIGVPPSGPMDSFSLRLGNRLLGNPEGTAALEITLAGPTLRFHRSTRVCVTGAPIELLLDGRPAPFGQVFTVPAGATLEAGNLLSGGCRAYLCVAGGFDVPDYLGSKSTFTLGQFGGHAGRNLRTGDLLKLQADETPIDEAYDTTEGIEFDYPNEWEIGVLYGPHGAPDFFTEDDIRNFFNATWEVHYNSARTGVRLIGPKPTWARKDGGEAGLHPSNIHDNAYAIGTIDFTGDMPVILGPDGPSLGGFVCPATIVAGERWKMGQLRPGNKLRFRLLNAGQASVLESEQENALDERRLPRSLESLFPKRIPSIPETTILHQNPANPQAKTPEVTYRPSGDRYLLIEYGPMVLNLRLRFRVHALMQWLKAQSIPGILELTPGIRSLQVHYDNHVIPLGSLVTLLSEAESHLPPVEAMEAPTRIVHLPLSWDDASTQLAIQKYMQIVSKDAPWCPSNIEFIRRINGLDSIEQVKEIVFNARYLVLGLGDVYLGAPVAVPLDPRHRLVTTKYNPARTWTPENAVGIGGAYLCIYGMEGPGGYQFVGRTLQMWNRYRQTPEFEAGKPWLLRFFDQIQFYPVSADELTQIRKDFIHGRYPLRIEHSTFKLKDHQAFIDSHQDSIRVFKQQQQSAFEKERESWAARGQDIGTMQGQVMEPEESPIPKGCSAIESPVPGSIWKLLVEAGETVGAGQPILIVESMKTEISIPAQKSGTIVEMLVQEGQPITAGQRVAHIRG